MPPIRVINHTTYMKKRTEKIQYIILHYSASIKSSNGSAMGTVSTLDGRRLSSDFAVDDNEIIQFANDPAAWRSTAVQQWSSQGTQAGRYATNNNSVSIEMSSTLDGGKKKDWVPNNPKFRFTNAVLENTAYLCKILIAKYNIPRENIIRHYDIMGKLCPGIIGWNRGAGSPNDSLYQEFVNSVYDGTPLPPGALTNYQYDNSYQQSVASSTTSYSTAMGEPNRVMRLSSAGRFKDEKLYTLSEDKKNRYLSLQQKLSSEAPDMGRDIYLTEEMYDSNILKGGQQSTEIRT